VLFGLFFTRKSCALNTLNLENRSGTLHAHLAIGAAAPLLLCRKTAENDEVLVVLHGLPTSMGLGDFNNRDPGSCANEVVEYKCYLRNFRNTNTSRVSITGVAFVS
jgi:hypothetical protein